MRLTPFLAGCAFALTATWSGATSAIAGGGTPPGNFCHLSWDIPCCPDPTGGGTATVTLTICNGKPDGTTFDFIMNGPPGVMFMPAMGTVQVAPGGCANIPIVVKCPPGLGSFQFGVDVIKPTGEQFSCLGSIRDTGGVKATPTTPVVVAPLGVPVQVQIVVQPPLLPAPPPPQQDAQFDMVLQATPGFGNNPDNLCIFVAPNTPPGQFAVDSFFDITYFGDHPLGPGPVPFAVVGDVIIMGDTNGDGVMEPIGSVVVIGVPRACAADLNGDGIVDTGDLGILISLFGQLCF